MASKLVRKSVATGPYLGLLYGPQGVGKTSAALSYPDPVIIAIEDKIPRTRVDGETLLEVDKVTGIKTLRDFKSELNGLVEGIMEGEYPFKTIVIDTIDKLEPIIWQSICDREDWTSIDDAGYGKGYTMASEEWFKLIGELREIVAELKINIVMLAHSKVGRYDPPDGDGYSRYVLAMHDKSSALVTNECDYVGFIKHEESIKEVDKGFGNKATRGVGGDTRVAAFSHRPSADAKSNIGLPKKILIPPQKEFYPLVQEWVG